MQTTINTTYGKMSQNNLQRECSQLRQMWTKVGYGPYGIFWDDTDTDIRKQENIDIGRYYIYSMSADVGTKYLWQRYIMEAGYLKFE